MKRFYGLAPAGEQPFSAAAFKELMPRATSLLALQKLLRSRPIPRALPSTAIPRVLRADEVAPRSSAIRGVLDALAMIVVVIAAIGKDRLCALRQLFDFGGQRVMFAGGCGMGRSQQGKDRATRGRRNHDFVAVALDPAVVSRATPGAVPVDTTQTFGNSAGTTIAMVPLWSLSRDQAFVHGNDLRICQSFRYGLFA